MTVDDTASVQDEGWDHDPHEHEGCFIFASDSAAADVQKELYPAKRRKVSKNTEGADVASHSESDSASSFRPLLNGTERQEFVDLRRRYFEDGWIEQENRFHRILRNVNGTTLDEVAAFVGRAEPSRYDDRLPTGLIIAGPSIGSHGLLFQQIASRIKDDRLGPAVILRSGDATNLKSLLKLLIDRVTRQTDSDEDDEEIQKSNKGRKLLNYDLQILYDFVVKNKPKRVVVAFQDSEAFDSGVILDVLNLLRSWLDRIPFVALFGIATSEEIFHQKLPNAAIRCLRGERFDVERSEESLERLFNDATSASSMLRLGPGLSGMLLDRQRDHVQSVEAFISAVKYSYMSHFFANPLSIFTPDGSRRHSLQPEHFEALRNLRSFRNLVEDFLESGNLDSVKSLLEDDDYLESEVTKSQQHCRNVLQRLLDSTRVIYCARACMSGKKPLPLSELYIKATSGQLRGSPIVREILLSIKRMSSDGLSQLLASLITLQLEAKNLASNLIPIQLDLEALVARNPNSGKPLRSEHDVEQSGLRTTVVAQKVELSKRKSDLSEQESAFSQLVQRAHTALQLYFTTAFAENLQSLFCHELVLYDLKGSHRDAFAPKPRFVVERALSTPHDYLNCSCCSPDEALSATQPPTAILYQLYLESGALINVFDLWSAFYTIVGGEGGEDCDERNALALFYRAFAELKQMGMVKHSRKKTDHVAKLVWKGL
ncbi:MAG: hypothetical protein M4579_002817 [Chaenotheca gracillima]|nr:MAG: hypothetical protein M4579_002817 [Chaenotheca gracillima]